MLSPAIESKSCSGERKKERLIYKRAGEKDITESQEKGESTLTSIQADSQQISSLFLYFLYSMTRVIKIDKKILFLVNLRKNFYKKSFCNIFGTKKLFCNFFS